VIRVDAVWLATAPLDMRAGYDKVLARVVDVFGAARPHHAYVFANARATRLKILIHDGVGLWLAARRLHRGRFKWSDMAASHEAISTAQLTALALGLPWRRVGDVGAITLT